MIRHSRSYFISVHESGGRASYLRTCRCRKKPGFSHVKQIHGHKTTSNILITVPSKDFLNTSRSIDRTGREELDITYETLGVRSWKRLKYNR